MVDGVHGHVGHVNVAVEQKVVLENAIIHHLSVEEVIVLAQVLMKEHVAVLVRLLYL